MARELFLFPLALSISLVLLDARYVCISLDK